MYVLFPLHQSISWRRLRQGASESLTGKL